MDTRSLQTRRPGHGQPWPAVPAPRGIAATRGGIPLAAGMLLLAAGLWLAGAAAAQQPPGEASRPQPAATSGERQPAAKAGEQPAVRPLSPATIRMLQHSLIQGGYAVDAADGVWGPQTEAAVREFQRVKGLQATGRADPQTLAALGVTADGAARPGSAPGARQPPAGDGQARPPEVRPRTPADLDRATIRAVQQALDRQGLQVGSVDGVWGERTATAIGNFQRSRGMAASGELDAHTLAALGLLPGGQSRVDTARSGRVPGPADLDPAAIRMIQQALNRRGFEVGAADGVWGGRTTDALRAFQRAQGIEPDGEPDVYTLAALGLLPGSEATHAAQPRPAGSGPR